MKATSKATGRKPWKPSQSSGSLQRVWDSLSNPDFMTTTMQLVHQEYAGCRYCGLDILCAPAWENWKEAQPRQYEFDMTMLKLSAGERGVDGTIKWRTDTEEGRRMQEAMHKWDSLCNGWVAYLSPNGKMKQLGP